MENTQEQLEAALSFANYQSTLNQQRKLLREKFESDCILAYNGGLFNITQEWLASFDVNFEWVLDINGNPIKITDPQTLLDVAKETYHSAVTSYGEEYQKLRAQRSVKLLAGL